MFTDDELIAKLRVCILKNTAIDAFYQSFDVAPERHQPKLDALMHAVSEGNPDADIFSDPDCSSYLLYLIENKKIPFWSGMTVYVYCIALMQFTKKQSLRPEHERYQLSDHGVKVTKFMLNQTLTQEGREYLSAVKIKYAAFPWLAFDEEKILQAAGDGAAVDAWLIHINAGLNRALAGVYNLMRALVKDVAYLVGYDTNFIMPPFVLMNAFHALQCDEPMQFQPGFGISSKERLTGLHEENAHSLALYSPLVANNLLAVHEFDCGPLMALVHDIAHCFWANLLTKAQRDLILKDLVQVLLQADKILSMDMDARLKTAINKIVFEWRDFNFSPLSDFPKENPAEFFMHFLVSAFGRGDKLAGLYVKSAKFKDTDTWSEVQDDLLYLLGRLKNGSDLWAALYENNKSTAIGERNPAVIAAIETAVEQSIPLSEARCTLFAAPAKAEPHALKLDACLKL
jgi:hypothetical protein